MMNSILDKIDIKELTWTPDRKGDSVLDKIDISLEKGHFYGLLGPNGAGKTSLVRHILGLIKPDAGKITFDDTDIRQISRLEMAKRIAFLPQTISANVDFSVYDVVAMGREPHRKRFTPLDGEDVRIIEEAMEFTQCSHLKDKSIAHISGGERQRVMIARTIAQDTPWIVLDEPISNLDIKHQTELMQVMDKLKKEKGKTIISILHDINLAGRFCDYVFFMKSGKIIHKGNVGDVPIKDVLQKVYGMDFELCSTGTPGETFVIPKY